MPLQGANATFRGAGQRIAKLFKSVILALQDPKNVEYRDQLPIKELKDEDERFRLWAANLGVFASGHASLEYRLRDAPKIESWVQETLDELVDELNQSEYCSPRCWSKKSEKTRMRSTTSSMRLCSLIFVLRTSAFEVAEVIERTLTHN